MMASEHGMRVLVIQQKAESSEAKVFATLLMAMQHEQSRPPRTAVRLIQFGHDSLQVGERLRDIAEVEVASFDIGGALGIPQPRRAKILSLARLCRSMPAMLMYGVHSRPDVIYSSQQHWDVRIARLLAVLVRRPHVIHLHYLPGPWLGFGTGWLLRHSARVICVSDFLRRKATLAGVPSERAVTIRNVLPSNQSVQERPRDATRRYLCHALGIPVPSTIIGMVARLSPSKGQVELVKALLPVFADSTVICHLVLVGDEDDPQGCYARTIRSIVQQEGVKGRVHLLGKRSDVSLLLQAFDVFAHPSFDDPCPLAVVEALLAGLPTVVWDTGGAAELVREGASGIAVKTGDIDGLSAVLHRLCVDSALRDRMRAAAVADRGRLTDTGAAGLAFWQLLNGTVRGEKFKS